MEIFADTANLKELEELISLGVVDGCTTNPSIVSKEKGISFEEHMKKVLALVKGPVSIEVTTNDAEEMIKEARKYATWADNVVIKIPMGLNGLKAVKILSEEGIKTNVTACMTMRQAVLAAKAGATYVSLFWGRMEDLGMNTARIVEDTVNAFNKHNFKAKIIIGSIRQLSHINQILLTGAHVITIPTQILLDMAYHPRTESTIQEFLANWEEFRKSQK